MTDKKISELSSITNAELDEANDTIAIVDTSATQTKKISIEELFKRSSFTVFTGNTEVGSLYFADPDANQQGRLQYDHATDDLSIFTNNTEQAVLKSNGRVGFGTDDPLSRLHVQTDSVGAASVNVSADELVLERNANGGMTILTGNTNVGCIYFADPDGEKQGRFQYNHSTDTLSIFTDDAEVARFNSAGNFLVNTTSETGSTENANVGATIFGGGAVYSAADIATSNFAASKIGAVDGEVFRFSRNGSDVGSIDVTAGSTTYNTTSDYRLKEDLKDVADPVGRLKQIKMYDFAWKEEPEARTEGVMAHELQKIVPQAVTGEKDGEDMQKVDYSKLVPLLTASLQEAMARIENLESQLQELNK